MKLLIRNDDNIAFRIPPI